MEWTQGKLNDLGLQTISIQNIELLNNCLDYLYFGHLNLFRVSCLGFRNFQEEHNDA